MATHSHPPHSHAHGHDDRNTHEDMCHEAGMRAHECATFEENKGAHECAHAHDHAARAPLALQQAQELCKARGERLTPIRQRVLAALYTTHKPLSAYDLIETLAGEDAKRLAPVTIYRTMDFLIAQGLAHRLESRNAFIACPLQHGPDELVIFMICERCGGVDEVGSEALGQALHELTRQHRFKPHMRIIELAGTCSHCG